MHCDSFWSLNFWKWFWMSDKVKMHPVWALWLFRLEGLEMGWVSTQNSFPQNSKWKATCRNGISRSQHLSNIVNSSGHSCWQSKSCKVSYWKSSVEINKQWLCGRSHVSGLDQSMGGDKQQRHKGYCVHCGEKGQPEPKWTQQQVTQMLLATLRTRIL